MNNRQSKDTKPESDSIWDKLRVRFLWLILCGLIGIFLSIDYWGLVSFLLERVKNDIPYIRNIVLGLPVFLSLWWFRTRDVRQQINKTETQIQQNSLFNGVANLSDKDPLKIDIGVAQLVALSKLNPDHDKTIRLAFIRRLKKCPLTKEEIQKNKLNRKGEKLGYAQHILEWITDKKIEADLTNCKLDCQDFTKKDALYNIVENSCFREEIMTCTRIGIKLTESEATKIYELHPKDSEMFDSFWIEMLRAGNPLTPER